jgi:hypothetical protein
VVQTATLRSRAHDRLDSWRSVADYLGCSPRTAQRWFSEFSLPVRRVGGGSGRIFAYIDELDLWLRTRSRLYNRPPSGSHAPRLGGMNLLDQGVEGLSRPGARLAFDAARRDRSCELQAIADRMWDTLSAADLGALTRIYRQAIDLDPDDACAFAGITVSLIIGGLLGNIAASSQRASVEFALQRAIGIDAGLLEVRTARAWARLVLERDWHGARSEFDGLLKERINFAPAVVGRALLHIAGRQLPEARNLLKSFTAQYPLSAPAMIVRCWAEYLAGELVAAHHCIAQVRRGGVVGSAIDAIEALLIIDLNDLDKSIEALQVLSGRWPVHCPHHCLLQGALGYCLAVTRRGQDAREIAHALTRSGTAKEWAVAYPLALIALGLDDHSAALHWLKESYCEGSLWSFGFEFDPLLTPLRSGQQLHLLASEFGLPAPEREALQPACAS